MQAGYDKLRKSKDDLKEVHGEIEREIGSFIRSIKVGVDYTDHKKTLTQDEGFLAPPNGALQAAIPADLLEQPFTLDRGFGPILSWDPRSIEFAGCSCLRPEQPAEQRLPSDGKGLYALRHGASRRQARCSDVDRQHRFPGSSHGPPVHEDPVQGTAHDKYWMWLPSMNLNFRWDNGFVIRIAASKEYMRARLPDLSNAINFGYDPQLGVYSGSGGNPFLRPYQAKALDINLEKYFGSKGYIALQTFYKHIDTYIASGHVDNFDYSYLPVPPGVVPPTPIGVLFANVNTHGGHMYGAELAGTLPFDIFSPALDGFGITGGAGYTKTSHLRFQRQRQHHPRLFEMGR